MNVTPTVFVLVLLAVATAIGWRWWRRNTFAVRIENGEVTKVRGNPPGGFVRDVGRMCGLWKIEEGTVRGRRSGDRWRVTCGGGASGHRQAFQGAIDHPL